MSRSRGGEHRHRQPWREVECPVCGQLVQARPTRPGHAWHIRTHLTATGICSGVVAEVRSPH